MNFVCFDVGGTYIKYAVINSEGNIILKGKFETPERNCRVEVPQRISEKVKELMGEHNINAVGISTSGQVDDEKGEIVFASDNLPDYTGTKLSEIISRETGLEVFVENDVNAAALGEMWKGAAKEYNTFLCMTLGTGIGGAIIIGKKLYRGMGSSGEIGHTIINEEGGKCTCGCSGCYEMYASTLALVRSYKAELKRNGLPIESIDGEIIMERVRAGEEIASCVYDRFLDHIVTGIISVVHILDPGFIVIGGGISAQGKPFFDEINRRFQQRAVPSFARHTTIVPAELQNDAGVIGAAYLCLKHLNR